MAYSGPLPVQFCEHKKLEALSGMIGNTPLLAIHICWNGRRRVIYAKAEQYNLTGSIKDRMALNIMKRAYETGALKPGDLIVEATSGSSGIALAALGRALGHPVRIYMPDWMSEERKCLLRSLGAELCLMSQKEGGFLGAMTAAERLSTERRDVFLPQQFVNHENYRAHEISTGPEILSQLQSLGVAPDAFVAGVGTGGTVMGVGRALRRVHPGVRVHPLEPAESPTLSHGRKCGAHRIQGLFDEFVPAIVDLTELDDIISVSDGDAILMAQKLARDLGLAVGISSGANLVGALLAQEKIGPDAVVATVFCDDNKKYLSTDLARSEPIQDDYLTPQVELIGFETVR